MKHRSLPLAATVLAALAATTSAQARKVYDGVTISQDTLKSRCEGAGGTFSDLGDGRVVCKIHGIVIVCVLAIQTCHSNEARSQPSRVPKGILGSRPILGTGDGGHMNNGGNGGPQVK